MQEPKKMPIWVSLAFSNVTSRKMALNLIYFCLAFTLYCFPWAAYADHSAWVARIFLVDDWNWFGWSLATTIWYWLSLKWIDRHASWDD